MNKGGRKPHTYVAESLTNRIRQWFMDNPDEELSYRDIAVKFECTPEAAWFAVRELKSDAAAAFETVHQTVVVRMKREAWARLREVA